jgi:serine/threonine protein kinase
VPKIADLGVSKVRPSAHESSVIGTLSYMAPEVFQGDYGIEVDIWALGIIYLELLLGERMEQIMGNKLSPAKVAEFPSEGLLERIEDEKYREMLSKMFVRNPKERLDIDEVCSYFESLVPLC